MKKLLGILFLFSGTIATAQDTLNVLFIGNSYTYVNNLPLLVSQVAASAGDYVTYNSSAPGGYTFQQHTTNATTTSLIAQGNWDYVVLQEQSQMPAFDDAQVEAEVYPYACALDSLITLANPCTETVFYNTWGRKNGDASNCANFPPLCTYVGMDSLLQLRYNTMADSNDAILSPVAQLWRYLRANNPSIELYNVDESHPSPAGSYAAACAFFTVLFRKDPTLITFDSSLPANDALAIRNAAKLIVFDSIADWHVGEYDPVANFIEADYDLSGGVYFESTSQNADNYLWNFGDNNATSTDENPFYRFSNGGNYMVELIVFSCGKSDTIVDTVFSAYSSIGEELSKQVQNYPNPFTNKIALNIDLPSKPGSWQLLNAQGQLVQTGNLNTNLVIDGLGELPNGLYLLKLQVGDKTVVKRMVKN